MQLAFEYTPGWGALLTLVGTLGGVVLAQRSARSAERERAEHAATERATDRGHERELRVLELRDAHLGRLHDTRVAAYREFWLRMQERRRLGVNAQHAQGHWQFVKATSPDNAPAAEKAFAELLHSLEEAQSDAGALGQALVAVDLVASHNVRGWVSELRWAIDNERSLGLGFIHDDDPRAAWDQYVAAAAEVTRLEDELREAMSDELGLDQRWT